MTDPRPFLIGGEWRTSDDVLEVRFSYTGEVIARVCQASDQDLEDAIQAAGHMPFDVQALHIDVLVAGGQKSLMGPPGQGFLYVREAVAETMQQAGAEGYLLKTAPFEELLTAIRGTPS